MRKVSLLALLICFVSLSSIAQVSFDRNDNVAVKSGATNLKYPWVGGLNFPQFSVIDLNGDGIKDLFVFDRSGNKVKTFLNKGTPNTVDYSYAPQYESLFPKGLHDFVMLADYNCDGKEDIFTYTNGGMAVYRNDYSSSTGLKFTLVKPLIYSKYYSSLLNLYVSPVNIPAIADIDNDGDLDILTFEVGGTYVEFHQNLSKELYGSCDSLVFQWDQGCWGDFNGTSSSNDVVLHAGCKGNHRISQAASHSGSTLLALDMDNDGDKDLLIGCVCANNILYLVNGGTFDHANMIAQNDSFPANSKPVSIPSFPAVFYLDVDNDGLKDLIAAPNNTVGESQHGIWFYKNTGTATIPVFTYQKAGLFQDAMIDVGEGSYPVFFDQNADGLADIVIGNYGYYKAGGSYVSSLSLYQNTGAFGSPAFQMVAQDFAGLSSFNFQNIYPAFGDLDGDGDKDMIIGEYNGAIHYFTNTAGAGQAAKFSLTTANYLGIDVGQSSTPQLMDVNRDGKLDLLIGSRNGRLFYYENTGSTSVPAFALKSNTFGGVDVRIPGYVTGYSIPFLYDDNGDYKLLVGSETGTLYYYTHIDGNLNGTFTKADTNYAGLYPGYRSSICGSDLNGDGKPEFLAGNYAGGVTLYSQGVLSVLEGELMQSSVSLYPNPAGKELSLRLTSGDLSFRDVAIYNVLGEQVFHKAALEGQETNIFTDDLPAGFYICKLQLNSQSIALKFVVKH